MNFAREEKKGRFIATIAIFCAIFMFFSFRIFKIQIIDGKSDDKANTESVDTSIVKATRGQILDCNGKVLVGNRQGNDIIFNAASFPSTSKQEERNKIIISLIRLFEKNGQDWNDDLPIIIDEKGNFVFEEDREKDITEMKSRDMLRLNKYATADDCMNALVEKYKLQDFNKVEQRKIASVCYEMRAKAFNTANPYTFANDVSNEIASVIKENSRTYVGVDVEVVTYREYTDGEIAPHILGVTGVINAEEYADLKDDGYAMDDILGKTGIEAKYEENLKGKNGVKYVSTATDGTQTSEIKGLENGNNIVLTIDSGVQKVAQDSLKALCDSMTTANSGGGAVVVMNCRTGEVLAIASYPTFNLSTYYDDYTKLATNTDSPLYNRALLSTYAPGSTAKVSTAIGCLEEGLITEYSTKYCGYYYPYKGHNFVCQISHDDNNITVKTALQDSCNSFFFYYGGEKLGIEKLNMYRELLGLGQPTGIELPENVGVLDSPSYRTSIGQTWQPGFSLQSAIGQAGNLFTPIQLCNYVSTVANGGTRYSAHIIKSILSSDNTKTILNNEPKVVTETGFSKTNLDIVKAGMRLVVTKGSCKSNFGQLDVAVACKTGTSEVDKIINNKTVTCTNGFNISFAPYDNPEIAVAVAIEGATSGGSCAPVACDIYNYYFNKTTVTDEDDETQEATEDTVDSDLIG